MVNVIDKYICYNVILYCYYVWKRNSKVVELFDATARHIIFCYIQRWQFPVQSIFISGI